jgi:5'/3'-nucleotidase
MKVCACLPILAVLLAACGGSPSTAAEPFRVLVTNDDGVGAPGIAALVDALGTNPHLDVTVIAPATNQSGSGDSITTAPLTVAPAATASGFAATAVDGYPADSVLFGVLAELPSPPDVVVAGVNFGQNLAEFVNLSGTVGAALWAAREGVPAIAVSQGLPASDYADAAAYAAAVVERLRSDAAFRHSLGPQQPSGQARVLNVNFPTCRTGARRGIVLVTLGRSMQVVAYTLQSEDGGQRTYQPVVETQSAFVSDCTSTATDPPTDIAAMATGFASVTPLSADLSIQPFAEFRFLEHLR